MQQVNRRPELGRRQQWGLIGLVCIGLMVLMVGGSGCASRVFYNQDYRMQVDCAGIDPGKLQFYNDKEFLIRRKIVKNEVHSVNGVVETVEELSHQDIRIRRGTPCRIDSVAGNFYFVRFEIGEGNVVKFYKNAFDYYQIGADVWVRGRGSILYGGNECEIERIGNDCLLQVKNYQRFRNQKQRQVAGGLEVGTEIRDSIFDDSEDEQ